MTEAESSVGAIPVDDEATENDANVPVDDKSSKRVAKTTKLLEFVARSATFLNAKDGEGTNTWVKIGSPEPTTKMARGTSSHSISFVPLSNRTRRSWRPVASPQRRTHRFVLFFVVRVLIGVVCSVHFALAPRRQPRPALHVPWSNRTTAHAASSAMAAQVRFVFCFSCVLMGVVCSVH